MFFLFILLFYISTKNYLLFHSISEAFGIIIAVMVFLLTWLSRDKLQNNYLKYLGISLLFVLSVDFLHVLAYKGMGVFPGYPTELSVQLWILARYMQAISLLVAPFMFQIRARPWMIGASYTVVSATILYTIFFTRTFPTCYIDSIGLTPFKIYSEYLISAILGLSLILLYREKSRFKPSVYTLLSISIIAMILSELSFTLYSDVYGFFNSIGHFFKIIEFYLIYKAIVKTGIEDPYQLIFNELTRAHDQLEIQNINLRKLDEMKDRFVSTATHELRTPLTSISLSLDVLRNTYGDSWDESEENMFEVLERNSGRLAVLTGDLLDVQRIVSGRLMINPESVSLSELVKEVVDEMGPLIGRKNQELVVDVGDDVLEVHVDRVRLSQVIVNLVSNAHKFTPEGGVIGIKVMRLGGSVEVSVTDNGIGLSEDDIGKLFALFPDIVTGQKYGGSGLGLSISKGIIELHNGEIWAKSDGHGKGSVFIFRLPLSK